MLLRIALAASLLAGCNKHGDDGPPCGQVVDHMLDIMKSTAGGHGGMNIGSRQTMVDTCEQRHMPKDTRECLLASKDITGMAACSKTAAPPAHAQAPLGAPPQPAAPAAPGSGTPTP